MAISGLDDNARKHLEFIQAVIGRLATDSFLMKGWSLTVAAAFYGYAAAHANWRVAIPGLLPGLAFWYLDAYFLRQERAYRHLYDDARVRAVTNFSMNAKGYLPCESWRKTFFSLTLSVFYGSICVVGVTAVVALARFS